MGLQQEKAEVVQAGMVLHPKAYSLHPRLGFHSVSVPGDLVSYLNRGTPKIV